MSAKNLATVTNELIVSYGNTAKNVIQAYRVGNARITRFVDQRWATAVDKMGSQLSSEIRSNALAAEQKVTGYYTKSISLGTDGADMAVSKVIELAGKGVTQAAANANRFEKATGLTALTTIATAAVPAAVAVSGVASRIEAKSDQLVRKIAGAKPKAKRAVAKRVTASKPRAAAKAAKAPVARAVKAVKAVKPAKVVKEVKAAVTAE
jgi:hypothetical protein